MTLPFRNVRVFVSSTFRDMQAERDHLVRIVFPELRERLLPHRIHLIDIDLRWGVTREQAENDRALEFCLRQIDECRPFFIGLLGECYGWVPRDIAAALGSLDWAAPGGRSITELEQLYGVLENPTARGRALFYFRDPAAVNGIPEPQRSDIYVETDAVATQRLAALKDRIRASGHPVLDPYPARFDLAALDRTGRMRGRIVGLESFGEAVRDQLWDALAAELDLSAAPPHAHDTFEADRAAQDLFVESRRRIYAGRDELNRRLLAHVDGDDRRLLALLGPPGQGKSAVLARLCGELAEHRPDVDVIAHFVGGSARSTRLSDVLRRLLHDLCTMAGEDGAVPLPEELRDLIAAFHAALARADRRTVIIIDGLDQLEDADQARELTWLPKQPPAPVRLLLSAVRVPGGEASDLLQRLMALAPDQVEVGPLTDDERAEIIERVPSLSAKTLDRAQRRRLLDNPATRNPLFLQVALEELRGFGSFELLAQRIRAFPRPGPEVDDPVAVLFAQVIDRLEADFGRTLVRTALRLLACARRGLSERELFQLLSRTGHAVLKAEPTVMYPLLRQLRPYLAQRGALLGFYHSSLDHAVRVRLLQSSAIARVWHKALAEYFWQVPGDGAIGAARKPDELPWQLARASEWTLLKELLVATVAPAWDLAPWDFKTYWSEIEANSPHRLAEAYRPIIEAPEKADERTCVAVAKLLFQTGNLEPSQRIWEHLLTRWGRDNPHFAGASGSYALVLWDRGDLDGALDALAQAERACRASGDRMQLQACLGNRAGILSEQGDLEAALALFEEQEQICRDIGRDDGLAAAIGNQAVVHQAQGDVARALDLLDAAERLERGSGDLSGVANTLVNRAKIYFDLDDHAAAAPLLDEAEGLFERVGDRRGLALVVSNRAAVLARTGGDARAMAALQERRASLFRVMGADDEQKRSLIARAVLLEKAGDLDEMLAVLGQLETIFRDTGDVRRAECLRALAEFHEGRGELDAALGRLEALELLCYDTGDRHGLADTFGMQARVLLRRDEAGNALALLQGQAQIYREIDAPRDLAKSLLAIATLSDDLAEQTACRTEAREIAAAYGLDVDVDLGLSD